MMSKNPKVSVCVVTYNHQDYIRDCLQSLVTQETNFDFEILVADDCSTDATREIVQEFAQRYPSLIRPIFHPQNLGPFKNYMAVHARARGEYIAHLDGDDYALPGKLQAQSDHLDRHKECVIVWHRMKILDVKKSRMVDDLIDTRLLPSRGITQNDLLSIGSVACHSSKMYRAEYRFSESLEQQFLDFFVDAHQLNFGVAHYLDGFFGVYRANVGMSSGSLKTRVILLSNLLTLSKRFPTGRSAICAHVLRLVLGDIYHRNATLKQSFSSLLRVFSPRSVFDFIKTQRYIRMFRSPL